MRTFYFRNSIGEEKDLQLRKSFLSSPTGLGTSNKSEYERIGNGFYSQTFGEPEQINITFDLIFLESAYADYKEMLDWLYSGYDLSFVYCPLTTEYSIDVDVDYIEKAELIGGGYLSVPVSLLSKSLWYKQTDVVMNFAVDDVTNYRIYPFLTEAYYSLSNASNSIDFTATGHASAAMIIVALGPFVSPVMTLKETATNTVIGKCELAGLTVAAGEYLRYSTVPNDTEIVLVAADGTETDLVSYTTLADENYPEIPISVPVTIKFEFTGASTTAALYLREYRRGV